MRTVLLAATALLLAACGGPPNFDQPTPRPPPLATRLVVVTPTPETTPTPPPATPTPPVVRRYFSPSDFDPYAALYATERDGIFVTSRNPRGRYYYKWDDRRWMTMNDRVWFRTLEDLLTVYPARTPAP